MKIEFIIDGEKVNVSDKGYVLDTDTFDLGTPQPKLTYLELEGADGKENITNALTKDIKYSNRSTNFDFRKTSKSIDDYSVQKKEFEGLFVGQDMQVVIDDEYYLRGSFVGEYSRSGMITNLNIQGDCNAWKYELETYHQSYLVGCGNNENFIKEPNQYITEGDMGFDYNKQDFVDAIGKTLTLGLDVELVKALGTSGNKRVGLEFRTDNTDGTKTYYGLWQDISKEITMEGTIQTNVVIEKEFNSIGYVSILIQGEFSGTVKIGNPKIIVGDKIGQSYIDCTLENLTKFVEPKFIVDGTLVIEKDDTKYTLTSGISYPFIIENGDSEITLSGDCTVDIYYDRGFK